MASIISYSDGLRRIEFSLTKRGQRRCVRLGRVSMKVAESIKAKIEAIVSDKVSNRPHDVDLSKWLSGLDETMLGRLREAGLAEGVGLARVTMGDFLKRFFDALAGKPATRISYGHTRRNLETFFGTTKLLREVSASDADAWRAWLTNNEELSPATVARRVIAARTMWRKAIRWKLASENPFAGIKAGHQVNESRKMFVTRDVVNAVIDSTSDNEWKLIIALARYGGLRCPSEHFALKWGHVDWNRSRMLIHSVKTEHHEGKGTRWVPIFQELRPILMRAFEQAEPGSEYVIAKQRLGGMNLRQQFERLIIRAGEKCWPRLFQNLRASLETELMREYDLATVCKWIGNSPAVAAKHYAMSVDLDADFQRAAGAAPAQQNAQQSPADDKGPHETLKCPNNEKTPENRGLVDSCQAASNADLLGTWAVQDSNL